MQEIIEAAEAEKEVEKSTSVKDNIVKNIQQYIKTKFYSTDENEKALAKNFLKFTLNKEVEDIKIDDENNKMLIAEGPLPELAMDEVEKIINNLTVDDIEKDISMYDINEMKKGLFYDNDTKELKTNSLSQTEKVKMYTIRSLQNSIISTITDWDTKTPEQKEEILTKIKDALKMTKEQLIQANEKEGTIALLVDTDTINLIENMQNSDKELFNAYFENDKGKDIEKINNSGAYPRIGYSTRDSVNISDFSDITINEIDKIAKKYEINEQGEIIEKHPADPNNPKAKVIPEEEYKIKAVLMYKNQYEKAREKNKELKPQEFITQMKGIIAAIQDKKAIKTGEKDIDRIRFNIKGNIISAINREEKEQMKDFLHYAIGRPVKDITYDKKSNMFNIEYEPLGRVHLKNISEEDGKKANNKLREDETTSNVLGYIDNIQKKYKIVNGEVVTKKDIRALLRANQYDLDNKSDEYFVNLMLGLGSIIDGVNKGRPITEKRKEEDILKDTYTLLELITKNDIEWKDNKEENKALKISQENLTRLLGPDYENLNAEEQIAKVQNLKEILGEVAELDPKTQKYLVRFGYRANTGRRMKAIDPAILIDIKEDTIRTQTKTETELCSFASKYGEVTVNQILNGKGEVDKDIEIKIGEKTIEEMKHEARGNSTVIEEIEQIEIAANKQLNVILDDLEIDEK